MPRSKEIQEQMRNKIVDMYQSGKGYKAIFKALGLQRTTVRAIIHKWRKLGTVVNLPRSVRPTKITPRAQRRLIQEVIKEPRTTSKELQASLTSIKVSVHDSTIRKRQKRHPWESSKAKATADQKEHKGSSHICQKNILIIPKTFGQIFCGLMWQKLNFLEGCVSRYIWRKTNTGFHKKNIIPTVKHGGGSVMVWGCFAASEPGRLAIIDGTMNSALYQKILKENAGRQFVTSSSSALGLCSRTMIPNTPASPPLNVSRKQIKVLERPSQSPDLNQIEMLWQP